MNSTTQWRIVWDPALLPLQEMLPPESLLPSNVCTNLASTESMYLFGFDTSIPCLVTEEDKRVADTEDTLEEAHNTHSEMEEDFLTLFMIEECISSL